MADPVSGGMAAIGMAGGLAQGVLGAIGAKGKADAESTAYMYKAGLSRVNADIASQNADYARNVGEVDAQLSGLKGRQQGGALRAAKGAGGLDVNTGSAEGVQADQHSAAVYDQTIIRSNAAKQAYGYEVEAFNQRAQAKLYDMSADYARKAGKINALSSLIGGATSVASKWSQFSTAWGGGGGGTDAHHLVPG